MISNTFDTFETTIVSAFVTGINKKKEMDISHYLEYGKKLLCLPIPKIIFIEYTTYNLLSESRTSSEFPLTEFIFIDPKDIYLYTFISHITNFQINSVNPDKDTIDYLFVQCNKTEWVRQAIHRNTFKTKQFTWIDFGIYHIVKNDALFKNAIMKISQTAVEKLAVGNCWNLRLPFVRDIYKDVAWFFAGGIFGGEPQYLLEFADLVQQKCVQYITERKSFIWETNIWYLVYKDSLTLNPTFSKDSFLFSPYLAEHDISLLQNYGNTTDKIAIVSAVFAEVIKKKTTEQLYEHLYFLADIRCPLILFIDISFPLEIQEFIQKTYPNVYLFPLGEITFPWNSSLFLEVAGIHLPSSRNPDKDTLEHMWNMHSKVYCLEKALDIYPHNPFSFLWIDYDISDICSKKEKSVQTFLYELSVRNNTIPFPITDQMIIPGCWSKISIDTFLSVEGDLENLREKQESFLNNVSWRFCGNVLWGNPLAIRKFRRLYDKYFRNFLKQNHILTWEVNFWAYLESVLSDKDTNNKDKWNPIWYSADHNDSIFHIPSEFICSKLRERGDIEITYPLVFGKNYKPTSASYLYLKEENKHYLNTRFINYCILENGNYWWPEEEGRTIRNKNIFSELSPDSLDSICYKEMRETEISNYKMGGISEGIEDIRLFHSKDSIHFIGSTFSHSPNEKIQMITGKYDILSGELTDTFIIESPNDNWCEKNWIPIFPWNKDSSEEVYFIYKWYPMEIGRIVSSSDSLQKKLEIQIRHETSHFIFRNIRGSTCFLRERIEGTEGFVGVVHYSEDMSPTRHYFHRLVLLDKTDFKPLKYTDAFYFCNLSVEFCIGFGEKDNTYMFWISQMDRDPMRIVLEKDKVPAWNTCGKWGG